MLSFSCSSGDWQSKKRESSHTGTAQDCPVKEAYRITAGRDACAPGETRMRSIRLAGSLVLLLLCGSLANAQFQEQLIAEELRGGYQVIAVDLNKDRKLDLVAVASQLTEVVWFENPTWKRHILASNVPRAINAAAHDVDRDGIPELALAYEFSNNAANSIGIVAILQHKGDPRQPWSLKEIDRLPTSHRLRWANIDGSGKKVLVNAPLTGIKAVAPEYRDAAPLVFYRQGEWKREMISDKNTGVVHGLEVMDWDGDRREDVLTASFVGVHVHRFRKDGTWERIELTRGDPTPYPKSGSSEIGVGHLKNKRFLATIEPWHGNQVVVYSNEKQWARVQIDSSVTDGHALAVHDLNGDGRDDIIAAGRGGDRKVLLFTADDAGGKSWKRTVIAEGDMGAASCVAADLDSDKKADIVCIGTASRKLKWYRNMGR